MHPMARMVTTQFEAMARRLTELGLGYLSLDRAGSTLSTGERQRVQLARAVRNDTTGVLYVLDEPSVGLHPLDTQALVGVLDRLLAKGATIVLVEHDLDLIATADHVIDMGPGGGAAGGRIIATGTPEQIAASTDSITGQYLRARPVMSQRS